MKFLNTRANSPHVASAGGLDYDLNYRTRNNGAKLIVKYFNTSVAKIVYKIKIFIVLPCTVVSSGTARNSFKNNLDIQCGTKSSAFM